ncbi:actin binding LIM protein Uncoordinated 115a isoform X4 [Anticarsia gemmatalis]|uniref:actin binding LIM protein Uncoordinated 115a isoform X4 n=1 Tax=Anticarsia gemmatalis TaxID=129554 RepID=UPI003F7629F2
MRPKEETDTKLQTGTFILSEKIDDTKSKKSEKDMKKEIKRLEKEKQEREKREKKAREKEKEREKQAKKGKVVCAMCGGKCSGEVLRVSDKYFHTACFTCRTCTASLAKGGFFCKDGHYYCPHDYQRAFGTRCAACDQYVEGEVVSALGNTYHQKCFTCARCKRAFPSGEKVTYTGAEVVCSSCVAAPQRQTARAAPPHASPASPAPASPASLASPPRQPHALDQNGEPALECAGCGQELSEGQALVALDRQWHTWCFACGECGAVLQGEYMGREGVPYCERDYQRLYGVRCAYCQRYISGKVLQAGENHHFHPTCARCSKCGDPFGDGEEMFLQGAAIWHPRCGPAPLDPHLAADHDALAHDRASADLQFSLRSRTPSVNGSYCSPYSSLTRKYGYRAVSPGLVLREYRDAGACSPHRITTYSYLTSEPNYLRRPLQPYDRATTSPHFHRPPSAGGSSTRASSRAGSKASSRPGMRVLVDSIRSETPRPKSPHMNNEEPIELSHYPAAYKPPPGTKPKIERDDFPAPPYPYTDPERRRRWSDTYKGMVDSDDEADGKLNGKVNGNGDIDPKLRREEQELAKIETGIAQVFLKEVKEREKLQQWKKQNLDPRNASRTPSASREPLPRLRYSSPLGASPSRSLEAARDHEPYYEHTSHSHIPTYNVVSSLRAAPRPGYGLAPRSHTFSSSTAGDFTFSGMGDKTHSTDFSSGKSDISAGSITDVDRSAVTTDGGVVVRGVALGVGGRHTSASGAGMAGGGGAGSVRRSLPNMATSHLLHEPAKLYPYHLLLITNYRLPPDVDRLNLERHLSDAEFEAILQIGRQDFYRLPQWRRNELKRRARLF